MNALSPVRAAPGLAPLRGFVAAFAALLDETGAEADILARGAPLLGALVATDDWLPDAYAQPDPDRYRQYLLYRDERNRFAVVSFVWGPGQATPLHDHRVWGLVGVLRGAELVEPFERITSGLVPSAPPALLGAGEVNAFGPSAGDIHRVANAHDDRVSVSIHVYGADIGTVERATYDVAGQPRLFVSGYANDAPPDLWGSA